MDSSTSSKYISEQQLSIHDAQLTRIQRALGLVDRSRFRADVGKNQRKGHPVDTFDARKTSRYPFEGDVFLLAMSVEIRRNDSGKIMQVDAGVATLDTRDLARLGTGYDGKFWRQEIQRNTIQGCNRKPMQFTFGFEEVVEGEPLTAASFGRLRRDIAGCFEEARQKLAQGQPERKTVVVSYNAQRLKDVLVECADFRLEDHPGVIDIVDIAKIVPAYMFRVESYQNWSGSEGKAATTPAFDPILSWEDTLSKLRLSRPTGATSSAQCCLEALITCAVKDTEEKNHPLPLPGGDGGDFPGPFRKLDSSTARSAYEIEHQLSVSSSKTTAEIIEQVIKHLDSLSISSRSKAAEIDSARARYTKEASNVGDITEVAGVTAPTFKVSLKEKTKPAGPGSFSKAPQKGQKTAPPMLDDDDELEEVTARVASGLNIGARPYRPQTTGKASMSSSRNVQTGQSADVLDYESDFFGPAAPGASGVLSGSALPEEIRKKRGAYKIAGERFARLLCTAAVNFCLIESYAWQKTIDGRSVWEISPQENYLELAKIVVKSGKVTIQEVTEMLSELDKEIAGRNDVDQWHQGLPKNDVRRTKTAGHSAFTETLKKTRDILGGYSADKSI